jgi:glutathione S-transferase
MADMMLFGSRLSPFVEKVARALSLKGLPFRAVDLKSPLDLRRWNRVTGKMPVLEIDGERVWDSTFILRRLDALRPEPPLFAADAATAAAQRLLEDWSDEALYWYVMALRWTPRNAAATTAQITQGAPAMLRPLLAPIISRQIGRMPRVQGLGRLPYEVLVREVEERLDDLVVVLGAHPFFYAERPSAADLAVYGQLHCGCSGPTPDFAARVAARPTLAAFMRRVEAAAP